MTTTGNIITRTFAAVLSAAKSFLSIPFFNSPARVRTHLLASLQALVTETFDCFLAEEYKDNLYLFERRLHKSTMKCWYWLARLQQQDDYVEIVTLLKIIIDIGLLRSRNSDQTVFGFCHEDLLMLRDIIVQLFVRLQRREAMTEELARFIFAINQFEDCFEIVIKVSAKEPAVFVLFIGSLRNLHRELGAVNEKA